MGIDRKDYIVRGWRLPYIEDIANSDEYLSMIEGHIGERFSLILDSMCGRFIVFGESILSGGDENEGWEFCKIENFTISDDELITKYKEIFNETPENPETFIFTLFS